MKPDNTFAVDNYKKETGHVGHLMYVTLSGPWFYINGEKDLKFKTRGDNEKDLRDALRKYNIDYWESELRQIAREMSDQLYNQTISKKQYEVHLKRGVV